VTVLAVDGGGTSTRAVVADTTGACLGYAKAGSGNPVSAGIDRAADSFATAIRAALARSGVRPDDIELVDFCMAGGMTTGGAPAFADRLRDLGLPDSPIVDSDILGSYCAGTPALDGYCLEAGTGCGAIRVEASRQAEVKDGLGWLVGDDGSGFWIGHHVARAAFDDLDGRGPATALTALVLADLGVALEGERGWMGRRPGLEQAVRAVYTLRPVELSRLAHHAFDVADDPVAAAILARAAEGLANSLRAVHDPAVAGPTVFAGGVLSQNPGFAAQVAALAGAGTPVVTQDGTAGAVVLALRPLGVEVGEEVFATIRATLGSLVQRA